MFAWFVLYFEMWLEIFADPRHEEAPPLSRRIWTSAMVTFTHTAVLLCTVFGILFVEESQWVLFNIHRTREFLRVRVKNSSNSYSCHLLWAALSLINVENINIEREFQAEGKKQTNKEKISPAPKLRALEKKRTGRLQFSGACVRKGANGKYWTWRQQLVSQWKT